MKVALLIALTALCSSCYNRIGDLSLMSNRNFDKSENYALLKQGVEAKVKTKKKDIVSNAVDKATNSVVGGEYLQNVSLWISLNGKKMRIKGDVWGVPQSELPQDRTATRFKIGDKVQFSSISGKKTGVILDVSSNEFATVKDDVTGKSVKVKYKDLLLN